VGGFDARLETRSEEMNMVRSIMNQRYTIAALLLLTVCTAGAQTAAPGAQEIRVTLLGTAPMPFNPRRAGISTLVEAGAERFLIDAGSGVMERLIQAGFLMNPPSRLFITHLHSDHIIDIPHLLLIPWVGPSQRKTPLEVWGPPGTSEMMRHIEAAFAFDIHVRRDIDERISPEGIKVLSHEIREGVVYANNGVKITAFLVDHGLVKPAFGYRIDYAGHSVAFSGDTHPSDNLVKHCQGVDVLIHEVIDDQAVSLGKLVPGEPKLVPPEQIRKAIVGNHTTPEQAGQILDRVKPKLAVFSHIVALVDLKRVPYSGRMELGEDLMVIDIGEQVRVKRPPANAPSTPAPPK
jgi:ribonuclease Z